MKKWFQGRGRRWSGNDRHFGPFTWSKSDDTHKRFGVVLDSGDDEDTCHLRVYLGTRTLLVELPPIIEKYRRWIDTSHYSWGKPGGGYFDVHSREFGISCSDGFLQVFLGPQTHDSVTTKSWCTHLPWTQWRFFRISLYDAEGAHFWTQYEHERKRGKGIGLLDAQHNAKEACPKVWFRFIDYDGADIIATTHVQEREWKRGEKWCSWLSLFYRPLVRRVLDIHYSAEVGPRKGSWKGGTIGCSIDMQPGEPHEHAFIRHCVKEGLTYRSMLTREEMLERSYAEGRNAAAEAFGEPGKAS